MYIQKIQTSKYTELKTDGAWELCFAAFLSRKSSNDPSDWSGADICKPAATAKHVVYTQMIQDWNMETMYPPLKLDKSE